MKLAIALAAASVILKFTTPGPGSYYVFTPKGDRLKIVASGYATNACTVEFTIPSGESMELFRTAFFKDGR